jgi:hypothetical protein
MKHVFILGAGASREAGGPLMSDLLDRAERLSRNKKIDGPASDLVFRGLEELQIAHSKAALDINNVESVMAAFEMAALFGRLGKLTPEAVNELPRAITTVVAQTVEELVQFQIPSSGVSGVEIPYSYRSLKKLLKEWDLHTEQVALVTFNYDLALDVLLHSLATTPDYSLEDTSGSGVALLKLHGSLGWTTKAGDGLEGGPNSPVIIPLNLRPHIAGDHYESENFHAKPRPFRVRPLLQQPGLSGLPVIVPPTWAKENFYKSIRNVWRRAARELGGAENIYVFGYSLPEADHFFRLLYALGTVGAARLKRFWVFDPDREVEGRFRSILGQSATTRFRYFEYPFDDGVQHLSSMLRSEKNNDPSIWSEKDNPSIG